MDSGVVSAGRDPDGLRRRLALIGTNRGIASTDTASVLATVEVFVELAFIVIENDQGALVVWLLNHPGEVAFFTDALKLAPKDFNH